MKNDKLKVEAIAWAVNNAPNDEDVFKIWTAFGEDNVKVKDESSLSLLFTVYELVSQKIIQTANRLRDAQIAGLSYYSK